MDKTNVQSTLVQNEQSPTNQPQQNENQAQSNDNMLNTAPEIDLLQNNSGQPQISDQQNNSQIQHQQQSNQFQINTINAQSSLVQPKNNQQDAQNNQTDTIGPGNTIQQTDSLVFQKQNSQHNSEAISAGSGNSQTQTSAQQMQAAYANINASINPLLSIGIQQQQNIQKKNYLQPERDSEDDDSEYYSASDDESYDDSDSKSHGIEQQLPKREPFIKRLQNTKKLKLAKTITKSSNKFLFNRFFAQFFSKIHKSKYPVSFLAADGASHSLLHHITDYRFLNRAIKMDHYFETNLKQRIYPDLSQCAQIRIVIEQQLLWDVKTELQNGIVFQAQICTFAIQDDEVKIHKVSNLFQQACLNDQTISLYMKVDLVKDPLSFLMVELCGYQDNILRSYCHGMIKLSNGFEYKEVIKQQSSKINSIVEALDSAYTILDNRSQFATAEWQNQQQILQALKQNRQSCQNVFHRGEQHKIRLFSGSAIQNGDELPKNMYLCVEKIKNKTLERLSRLPSNFLLNVNYLRVIDHGVALFANSKRYFSGPESINIQLQNKVTSGKSASRSASKSLKITKKQQSRAPSRSKSGLKRSASRSGIQLSSEYSFESEQTLEAAAAFLASLLAKLRFRSDNKICQFQETLDILASSFNKIYKQKEKIRRQQMKASLQINGAVDRQLLPDFIQLLKIVNAAVLEGGGPKETTEIVYNAYRW